MGSDILFFRTYKEGWDVIVDMKIWRSFKWCFQNPLSNPLLCVHLLYWVHEKNVKEKELNFDLLSLTLFLWMILLELLICRERYQSSLRSTPNHSPASFCFLLQAVSFLTWANYISESRRERRFGQERTTCWQVLLGSLNLYPQGICFLLIGLLAHSDLADRKHNREAF